MPILILSILIQVAIVIHIVKTGRNTTWIWIVVMLPMAGAIAYLVLEVLPELYSSRAGRSASKKVQGVVKPNKDINAAAVNYYASDTVKNSMRLAEQCYEKGLFSDAKELYIKCLIGPHSDDPHLMFGLARSDFELRNYSEVKSNLDKLIELNPGYKNPDAHLLYARTLEKLNEVAAALHEYEALHNYYAGPEASFYFAMFLKFQNQSEKANAIFREIIRIAETSGKHYRSTHGDLIRQAKSEISA